MATTITAKRRVVQATAHGINVGRLAAATNGVQAEEALMSLDRRINSRPTQTWRPA